ncbi:MAG: 1-acyl-sn-glycerol-3-phosphate acyltransferase, partial [Desulfurobacteriaceae bacterium]
APIVPCLIEGSEAIIGKERLISGIPKVSVTFGKPFTIDLDDRKENYQRAADIMMEKIKELKSGN